MKFQVIPLCFLALASTRGQVAPLSPAQPPMAAQPATPAVPPDTIVAEVDGKRYTAAQVDKLMQLFPPQMQTAVRNDPKKAIGTMLMLQGVADEAVKAHLDQQSPVKEVLEYNRLTTLFQAEMNQKRNFEVKVEPADQEKYYKEHPDQFQEAKVKVIYVAFLSGKPVQPDATGKKTLTEAEAKAKILELRKQALAGADFAKLAQENSDDKESAAKGGDFGAVKQNSPYPQPIKNAVFALKPGQVSEPVRQPNGYYLIRLESVRLLPYEDVRSQIFDDMKSRGFNEWFATVQKRYEVKVENPAYFTAKPSGPGLPQAR